MITSVDYNNQQQATDLLHLLDLYARDPMGGGEPLTKYTRDNLVNKLKQHHGAFSFLSYHNQEKNQEESQNKIACGFVNCFLGFSTFKCKPLINIHDVFVKEEFRGRGKCTEMLKAIEEKARNLGCCKITLEVLEGNTAAKATYKSYGFENYALDPRVGDAQFWQKNL